MNIIGQKDKYPTVYGFVPSSSSSDIDGFTTIDGFTITNKGASLNRGGYLVIKKNIFKKYGLYASGSSYYVITNNKLSTVILEFPYIKIIKIKSQEIPSIKQTSDY